MGTAHTGIRADVNQDGNIDVTDAMLTLRYALGLSMDSTRWHASTTAGDVNCSGAVDATDAMLILRKALGLDMSATQWCVSE